MSSKTQKTLVIVESPGKIAKIGQYLGSDYIVKASIGHVQDLDKSTLSVDVDNNFKPNYVVTPDKKKVVKELQALAKDCKEVILAADGDREGEAIAWSLANVLKLKDPKRIIFHEITKQALAKALENPTIINTNMVNAQQSRRILDRLVGYLISPVLWKYLTHDAKSAGRVQSVVVKIIIDKENEISKSISQPYFKTTADFEFGNENVVKFSGTLQAGTKLYQFDSEETVKTFLGKISKKTEFKVVSVENKKSIRKPSPPFITSSLQQEASTKLRFSVKKTMDVAQKLYEAGWITYMRSDSPNISKEAIDEAKKYITETYGKEYADPKNYESKNASSQDAHECVRPTHIETPEPEGIDGDLSKLYTLIWKRTIASQMANAQVNIQTVQTDALIQGSKDSILLFGKVQTYFTANLENVEFPGYLIVYDNTPEDEEKVTGQLSIKTKDRLGMHKIKVSEEYTKPPLRYNEAALVRYLEKNGIGRPSTYASNISKVIERNYVEIKDVEGVKKQSRQFELSSKYNIKESSKEVSIGKEQKKLVSTFMGNQVNEFLTKHFDPIMDIEFTANFETYLDKIAEGKANWVTVLRTFYDMFNPIVEKLNSEAKNIKQSGGNVADRLLGTDESGCEVYAGTGKYGPYVKIEASDNNDKSKYRFAKLKEISVDKVTLDYALVLLEWPKTLGKIGNAIVTLNDGQFGLYIKCAGKNYSIKEALDPEDIDLDYAKELVQAGDPYSLKSFKVKDKVINLKSGEFGHYLQIVSGTKKQNIPVPKKYNIESLSLEQVLEIIASKNGTSSSGPTKSTNYPNKKTFKSKDKEINL
jgi:DNA topoisomerase-1